MAMNTRAILAKCARTVLRRVIVLLGIGSALGLMVSGGPGIEVVSALVPAVCPGPASGVPGTHVVQFQHANLARQMIVYIPATYQSATAVPVVIALHGGSGNAMIPYNNWGLTLLADQEGIIVAFPDGLPKPGGAANNLWLMCNQCALPSYRCTSAGSNGA
jgi:polyhydroxybutyrate depolymerase